MSSEFDGHYSDVMAAPQVFPRWLALPIVILGAYIILLSLGLLPHTPRPRSRAVFDSPQHWQITSAGIAFVCMGATIILANKGRWLRTLVGAVLLVALVAPMAWLLYFSGVGDLEMQIFASIPLVIGSSGAVFGLVRTAQGKSATIDLARDPAHDAAVFLAYGRKAQAKAVLLQGMKRYPSRAAEFQTKLDQIR